MTHSNLGAVLANRLRRCLMAAAGLVIFAFGSYLQLQADIGLSPWFALNQGLSLQFPFISYGQASILFSVFFIICDLLLRESIGLGTILNALVIGWASDVFLALGWVPVQTNPVIQLPMLMVGIVIVCVGQYIYMSAALSCGPRDALLVAVARLAPKISVGKVNLALLTVAQILAILMGGPFGIGTLITIFGTGVIMDWVFHLLRFEPRNVKHENLFQTLSVLRAAARGASHN